MYGSIQQKQFLLSQRKRDSVDKFILFTIFGYIKTL